jgi:hypothetical protein
MAGEFRLEIEGSGEVNAAGFTAEGSRRADADHFGDLAVPRAHEVARAADASPGRHVAQNYEHDDACAR